MEHLLSFISYVWMFEFLIGPWADRTVGRPDHWVDHWHSAKPEIKPRYFLTAVRTPMFFRSGFNHTFLRVNYIIGINFHFLFEIEPNYDVITMSHTKQNVIGTFSFAWDQTLLSLYRIHVQFIWIINYDSLCLTHGIRRMSHHESQAIRFCSVHQTISKVRCNGSWLMEKNIKLIVLLLLRTLRWEPIRIKIDWSSGPIRIKY